MKKIGMTPTGNVIVEMSAAQYDALVQIQSPQNHANSEAKPEASKMTLAEKVAYVRERIIKLKPKKRDGVVNSISVMFQFTGGLQEQEIQKVITSLQREKFFTIDADGGVRY